MKAHKFLTVYYKKFWIFIILYTVAC